MVFLLIPISTVGIKLKFTGMLIDISIATASIIQLHADNSLINDLLQTAATWFNKLV